METTEVNQWTGQDANRRGAYMLTFTGKKFYPMDIRQGDICIEDIAHGLAGMNRFGNQSPYRYTVAQHSVHMSYLLGMAGLLHDASEAYILDMPTPVKIYLSQYKEMEERLMTTISRKFGLPTFFWKYRAVKEADWTRLELERQVCWAEGKLAHKIWTPFQSEQQFISRYNELLRIENAERTKFRRAPR